MGRTRRCIGALLVVLASTTMLAQNLQVTEEWITNSLRPRGILGDEGNGYNYYSTAPDTHYTELIASFTSDGCKVRVPKETEAYAPGMFAGKDGKSFPELFTIP